MGLWKISGTPDMWWCTSYILFLVHSFNFFNLSYERLQCLEVTSLIGILKATSDFIGCSLPLSWPKDVCEKKIQSVFSLLSREFEGRE